MENINTHQTIFKLPLLKWIKRVVFCVILLLISGRVFGQSTVSGIVKDSKTGNTLPGVNVSVKGTTTGTSTDAEGRYQLQPTSLQDTLVFSFIGYESKSIPISGRNTINVQLAPTIISGNQVVVVGYGTQKKSTLTGSVSSVPSAELDKVPTVGVQSALQGRVAGMEVTSNGGPGEEPIIHIRGISSISYASDPLYVIDGLPSGNLTSIDSKDIQSVEVLKDASAAAIYGSRATNGVILITTKKGSKSGGVSVNFNSYVGMQSVWNKVDLLNTQQYLKYVDELKANGMATPPRLDPNNFNQPIYKGASQTYAETNTNWQDAYFRRGLLTNEHLSLSGGNEDTRFYLSGGYYKQEGIAVGQNFQRGHFRINSEHDISKVFSFGENFYLSHGRQRYDNTGGNRTRLVNVIRSLPYLPVHDPTTNGGYRTAANSIDGADPTNPVMDSKLIGQAYNNPTKIMGTAYLDADLTPWLNFRSTFGMDYARNFQHQFNPIYDSKGVSSSSVASITNTNTRSTVKLYTQQLTFDKTFEMHHVKAVAVYEQQENDNFSGTASGDQATNSIETLTGATNVSDQTTESKARLISYVGRINYDYDGKYLLNLAVRRDGLSIWAPGHKWATFPSASVGWRIDKERFMQNQSLISELKIRGGYGVTGLNGLLIGNYYPWQVSLQANGATYPFNNTNSVGNASYYDALGNTNLSWEKTNQLNVALDLGLLSNRITLTAEYYKRSTDNLLLNVPTPPSFGFFQTGQATAGVRANVGEMENKGLDLQLGYHKRGGVFTWDATGLVSVMRNKVIALNTPNGYIGAGGDQDFGGGEDITRTEAGHPIQSFYGYVVDGIFQNWDEVYSGPKQHQKTLKNGQYDTGARADSIAANFTAPGDIRFKDISGPNGKPDGVIDAYDRKYLGSYIPDFSYSLNFNANYKNFDFSLFLQGVQGNKIFNAERIIRQGMVRLFGAGDKVLDAWTPQNKDTDIPRAVSSDPNGNARPSTRWVEDGSYLRVKNLQIGYRVPPTALGSFAGGSVRKLRLYVSAQNLLTFTGYDGWDPEIGSKNTTLTNGIDYGQYPVARSFLFGIQLGL